MEEIPHNGDEPLTHEEFANCWMMIDRRIGKLEVTSKISIGIAVAIFVAVIVSGIT